MVELTELAKLDIPDVKAATWNGVVLEYHPDVEASAAPASPSNAFAHLSTQPKTIAKGR